MTPQSDNGRWTHCPLPPPHVQSRGTCYDCWSRFFRTTAYFLPRPVQCNRYIPTRRARPASDSESTLRLKVFSYDAMPHHTPYTSCITTRGNRATSISTKLHRSYITFNNLRRSQCCSTDLIYTTLDKLESVSWWIHISLKTPVEALDALCHIHHLNSIWATLYRTPRQVK